MTNATINETIIQESGLWSATTNISNTPGSDSRYPNLPLHSDHGVISIWTEGESSPYDIICWFDPQTSAVNEEENPLPEAKARLLANHPNPFNPATTISFDLPQNAMVTLAVLDARGQLVKTLISEPRAAGINTIVWRGGDDRNKAVPSGVYFSRLSVNGENDVRKMILIR